MSSSEFFLKNRPTILFICFSILNIIVILTHQTTTPFVSRIRTFFIYFLHTSYRPVYTIINYPINVADRFIRIPYLYDENIKLKEKLKKTIIENKYYRQVLDKFNYMLENKNIELLKKIKVINATVILRDYKDWYNECVVYLEKFDDIKKDNAVVILDTNTNNLFFVGRIWEIEGKTAKILLLTNPLSNIPVKVKGKNIYGMAVGNSSAYLDMEYILLDDDIKIGDVIETIDINNLIGGLEIGKITSIEVVSSLGFKRAKIKLSYNINMLKELLIMTYPQ